MVEEEAVVVVRNPKEYRAIFSSPYGGSRSLGPVVETLQAALESRPERSEETHEYVSGVEIREVTPWRAIPVDDILKAKGLK